MIRKARAVLAVLGAGSLAAAAWVYAGPLNPPEGAVSPSGKTTQEIYDAVQGVGTTVTGAGRIAGIPGANTGAGTIEFPLIGAFPKVTSPLVGFNFDVEYLPVSGGAGGGTVTLNPMTVVRDLDQNTAGALKALLAGTHLQVVTVKLTNPSGTITYKLTDVLVLHQTVALAQRADGTFAQLETLALSAARVDVTTALGTVTYDPKGARPE